MKPSTDLPPCCHSPEDAPLAHRLYAAYNRGGDPETAGLNFRGDPCPEWGELPENVRAKWEAVARGAANWAGATLRAYRPSLPPKIDPDPTLDVQIRCAAKDHLIWQNDHVPKHARTMRCMECHEPNDRYDDNHDDDNNVVVRPSNLGFLQSLLLYADWFSSERFEWKWAHEDGGDPDNDPSRAKYVQRVTACLVNDDVFEIYLNAQGEPLRAQVGHGGRDDAFGIQSAAESLVDEITANDSDNASAYEPDMFHPTVRDTAWTLLSNATRSWV